MERRIRLDSLFRQKLRVLRMTLETFSIKDARLTFNFTPGMLAAQTLVRDKFARKDIDPVELEWATGLFDADGHLGVDRYRRNLRPIIMIGMNNQQTLLRFRQFCNSCAIPLFRKEGYKLKKVPKGRFSDYVIPDLRSCVKETAVKFAEVFWNRFVTEKKVAHLTRWKETFGFPGQVSYGEVTWPWLAGFIDGDGCLQRTKIQITQKEKIVLDKIEGFLLREGCDSVYRHVHPDTGCSELAVFGTSRAKVLQSILGISEKLNHLKGGDLQMASTTLGA